MEKSGNRALDSKDIAERFCMNIAEGNLPEAREDAKGLGKRATTEKAVKLLYAAGRLQRYHYDGAVGFATGPLMALMFVRPMTATEEEKFLKQMEELFETYYLE